MRQPFEIIGENVWNIPSFNYELLFLVLPSFNYELLNIPSFNYEYT